MQQYTLIDLDEAAFVEGVFANGALLYNVYTLDGKKILSNARSLDGLSKGVYIVNGEKKVIE